MASKNDILDFKRKKEFEKFKNSGLQEAKLIKSNRKKKNKLSLGGSGLELSKLEGPYLIKNREKIMKNYIKKPRNLFGSSSTKNSYLKKSEYKNLSGALTHRNAFQRIFSEFSTKLKY